MPPFRGHLRIRTDGREAKKETIPIVLPGVNPESFVKILQEHVKRNYENQEQVTESWRLLAEIPTKAEIMGVINADCANFRGHKTENRAQSEPILPVNLVDRPWLSNSDYISTHYKLLREDAIDPLRNAVAEFRASPRMNDSQSICIYEHVHLTGYTFCDIGPAPRVEFSTRRAGKKIRWEQSKRLQQGTMVALSTMQDMFQTICKVAIVAARPVGGVKENPPRIDLFWGDVEEAEFDPTVEYIMVEARSGYYEATRHMLVAMQKLMSESFPLAKHLVNLDKNIKAPEFVEKQPFTNLTSLVSSVDESVSDTGLTLVHRNALENVDILKQWPTIEKSSLDESQMIALKRILTKKVAIVQGPPGTGKTFVSISALLVALQNWNIGDPPILVAAQTNHALDQLLLLVANHETSFIRIGGRACADNKAIIERTLFKIRSLAPSSASGSYHNRKNARNGLRCQAELMKQVIMKVMDQGPSEIEVLRELGVISQAQFESIVNDDWAVAEDPNLPPGLIAQWLGFEQLDYLPTGTPLENFGLLEEEDDPDFEELNENEIENAFKDDDEIEALRGDWYPIKDLFSGKGSKFAFSERKIRELLTAESLWDIKPSDRGQVYRYIRREVKERMLGSFHTHMREYLRCAQNVKVAKWQADATLIRSVGIKLIGCTTTGLSKYRGLLASLKPRTLLVEEAAETLEGTVLAAMFESLEQLVLVGDHQQLQAHSNVDYLGKAPYNLAVSMFERLVNNGIEYTMLNVQRRMIPEIRELLDPFYPNLKDHPTVLDRAINRKPVPGMGGRDTYFFHHIWPESRDETSSRRNEDEAEMIVKFLVYLNFNGTNPSKVTILTFYNGQRRVLQKKLKSNEHISHLGPFNVFTVDSYQGEENDVVLLSLVRSNEQPSIGFLANKNRAVVSLSRARRGMYIFGNSINLLASSSQGFELWGTVTKTLQANGRLDIDSGLPIVCSTHGTESIINEPVDWDLLIGGCNIKCDGKLPCGHFCPYSCHPFSHDDIICKELCVRSLTCGHGCGTRCGDPCVCPCDDANSAALSDHDEGMWQSSPTRRPQDRSYLASLRSDDTRAASPLLGSSEIWNEWAADRDVKEREENRVLQETQPVPGGASGHNVYVETHRPVIVQQGARVSCRNVTKTVIPRHTSPRGQLLMKSSPLDSTGPLDIHAPSIGNVLESTFGKIKPAGVSTLSHPQGATSVNPPVEPAKKQDFFSSSNEEEDLICFD